MLPKIEAQIERFAPDFANVSWPDGFRATQLEAMDANLVGGDMAAGWWTFVNFYFDLRRAIMRLRRGMYTYVRRRLRREAACTGCADITRRRSLGESSRQLSHCFARDAGCLKWHINAAAASG